MHKYSEGPFDLESSLNYCTVCARASETFDKMYK